jgi:hypothetical protein
MKKIFSFFTLSLLLINFVFAQNVATEVWSANFGVQDTMLITPMTTDNFGNVYIAGFTLNPTSGADIAVVKYDAHGDTVWTAQYSGSGAYRDQATCINLDNNYNLVVGGFSYISSTNKYDYIVLKYDSSGTQQWVYTYNGTGSLNDGITAITTYNNSIYATGTCDNATSLMDYKTIKLDSLGNLIWNVAYNYTNLYDIPYDIAVIDNNVFVTGGSQSGLTDWDYATVQYSLGGTPIDTLRITGTGFGFDHASQVITDNLGYVYITGAVENSGVGLDYKTVKMTQQGVIKWISTYDNPAHDDDIANSITVDLNGNVYVTGQSKNSSGNFDYCTIKYDSLGSTVWTRFYNNSHDDKATRITSDADNNLYLTGSSSNGANNDFATIGYNTDGDTLWTKRFNGGFNGIDEANFIKEQDGYVYISGQSQINSTQYEYITIAYGQANFKEIGDPFNEPQSSSLWYYPNEGQILNDTGEVADIAFYTLNQYPSLYFNKGTLSYVFSIIDTIDATTDTLQRIDMSFMDTSNHVINTRIFPNDESSHFLNFYLPHCPTGIVNCYGNKNLFIEDLYEGIDLYYSSNQSGEKHYFVIEPGAKYGNISMKFNGADSIQTSSGKYTLFGSIGNVSYDTLVAYEIDASGNLIPGTSQTIGLYKDTSNQYYHFTTLSFNSSNNLVILVKKSVSSAPLLPLSNINWSTYLGNNSNDDVRDIEADNDGFIFIAGSTNADLFPNLTTAQFIYNASTDAIVQQYDSETGEFVWGTYFGGSSSDLGSSVGVDLANPNIYLLGHANSNNIPSGSLQYYSYSGSVDIFIAKFSGVNGTLAWSTYFGGSGDENTAACIAYNDKIFFGGFTLSQDIQIYNQGYMQPSWNGGNNDAFIGAFKSNGIPFWLTYFGGNGMDNIGDFSIDDNEHIFITGVTTSNSISSFSSPYSGGQTGSFPIGYDNSLSPTPYLNDDLNLGQGNIFRDGFIAEFDESQKLVWSTFVGGSLQEHAFGYGRIKVKTVNGVNKLFISGMTGSADFPLQTINSSTGFNQPYSSSISGQNIFLTRFIDRVFDWSTLFGGDGNDYLWDMVYADNLDIYLVGKTNSSTGSTNYCGLPSNGDFPLCDQNSNYYFDDIYNGGNYELYLAGFNDNTEIIWSTFVGGQADENFPSVSYVPDIGNGCKLVIAASTNSTVIPASSSNFPLWQLLPNGYWQPNNSGAIDLTITRFDLTGSCFPITSISESKNGNLVSLFPNPTNGNFLITNESDIDYDYLNIFSVEGKLIFDNNKINLRAGSRMKFDLNKQIQAGIYFLKLGNSDNSQTFKIIIQ